MDVADVNHRAHIGVGVDRVDERGSRVELGLIALERAVRSVAVDGKDEPAARAVVIGSCRRRRQRAEGQRGGRRDPRPLHHVVSLRAD